MIVDMIGDILAEPPETWVVIPVNCRGVAGAGLAKQWKERCPLAYARYRELCNEDLLGPDDTYRIATDEGKFVLAATKDDWRTPSDMEWVWAILEDTAERLEDAPDPVTLALPMLGAGLGGLDPDEVREAIDYFFGTVMLEHHTILVYGPR